MVKMVTHIKARSFLAVSPFLGFLGVACAFNGFAGHMRVNCTTILTNNAMMEEP